MSALPEKWEMRPISELGKVLTGNTPPTSDLSNYGDYLPFIKPTQLVDAPVSFGEQSLSQKGCEKSRVVPKGGVLVSCIGNLGKTAIAKREVAFNQQINAVIFNEVIPEYGFYYFQTLKFRKQLNDLSSATTISIVNKSKFESISIPIAPLEQQKQIVAKIEELFSYIDAGIDALKQSKQLLKQYRQSVLKAAVTGELSKEWREQNKDKLEPASKLLERILHERRQKWEAQQLEQFKAKGKVPKDEGWKGKYVEPIEKSEWNIDVIPDGWTQCHLDQLITELKNGISAKPTEESGLAIFRISAVRPLKVNLEDIRYLKSDFESSGYELENGDLLFTRYNGNAELVGVCGQVRNLQAKTVYPDKLMRVRLVSDKLTCTDYIELVCNTGRSRDYIQSKARTTAGQTGVSGGDVKKIPLPFPPYEEQVIISKEVESRISSIIEMEKSIDSELQRSDRLKQSVLQSAFNGKLTDHQQSSNNIIQFPVAIDGISETDIHAGIIALAIKAHEKNPKTIATLGHVKAEKIAHLVESHLGISLGRSPYKDAAGPNDYKHLHKIDSRGKKVNWFEAKKLSDGRHQYVRKSNIDKLVSKVNEKFGDKKKDIDELIALMVPLRTEHAEVVATLYAGWNNLLLDGVNPTDEQIVYESRENWHVKKLKIDRKNFFKALEWMRKHDLTPKGLGIKVDKK